MAAYELCFWDTPRAKHLVDALSRLQNLDLEPPSSQPRVAVDHRLLSHQESDCRPGPSIRLLPRAAVATRLLNMAIQIHQHLGPASGKMGSDFVLERTLLSEIREGLITWLLLQCLLNVESVFAPVSWTTSTSPSVRLGSEI